LLPCLSNGLDNDTLTLVAFVQHKSSILAPLHSTSFIVLVTPTFVQQKRAYIKHNFTLMLIRSMLIMTLVEVDPFKRGVGVELMVFMATTSHARGSTLLPIVAIVNCCTIHGDALCGSSWQFVATINIFNDVNGVISDCNRTNFHLLSFEWSC